jgi:hypothetical protein
VVGLTDSFMPIPDRRGLCAPNANAKFTAAATRLALVGGGR